MPCDFCSSKQNNVSTDAVNYGQYKFTKKTKHYDHHVSQNVGPMTMKITAQMNDRDFSWRDLVPIIAFLQGFKAVFDACSIHKESTFLLIKYFLTGSVQSVMKAKVALPTQTSSTQE